MRATLSLVLLALLGCTSESEWYPIPGAAVSPWAQTQAVCGPILQQENAAVAGGGGSAAVATAKAQYRACMGRNGWTDSPDAARADDRRRADRRADSAQLRAKIDAARTKNALTMLVGDAPRCQPGDPGTEICRWHWTRHLPTENVPLYLTCVLPRDGTPRGENSCRYGVQTAK